MHAVSSPALKLSSRLKKWGCVPGKSPDIRPIAPIFTFFAVAHAPSPAEETGGTLTRFLPSGQPIQPGESSPADIRPDEFVCCKASPMHMRTYRAPLPLLSVRLSRAAAALLVGLLCGNFWAPLASAAAVPWHPDLSQAKAASLISHRPVLIVFVASWSEASVNMEKTFLGSEDAVALLTACYEPVRIDVDVDPATTRRLGVAHLPTACVIDAQDRVLARFDCPSSSAGFVAAAGRAAQDASGALSGSASSPPLTAAAAASPAAPPAAAAATPEATVSAPPSGWMAEQTNRPLSSFRPQDTAPPPVAPAIPAPAADPRAQAPQGALPTPGLAAAAPAAAPQPAPASQPTAPWMGGSAAGAVSAAPPAPAAAVTAMPPAAVSPASPPEEKKPKSMLSSMNSSMRSWLKLPTYPLADSSVTAPPTPPAPPKNPAAASPSKSMLAGLPNPFGSFTKKPAKAPVAGPSPPSTSTPSTPAAVAVAATDSVGSLPLGLEGYCPVTLIDRGQWVEGRPQWGARHRGRTYLFAGADQQQAFLAGPDRYAPTLSGDDPVVAFDTGKQTPGLRRYGVTYQQRIYLFSSPETRNAFAANPQRYTERVIVAERPTVSAVK